MRGSIFARRVTSALAAAAATMFVFAGQASAKPAIDFDTAVAQLRHSVAGNTAAEHAIDALIAAHPAVRDTALPAQPFQVPAQSDIGQNGTGPGTYGSGIALGVYGGFQFGFFGGPGTISPNQGSAQLNVVWLNLANGRSGTNLLSQHQDNPIDTTIRTDILQPGGGPIVAAVYGQLWHRWWVGVSDTYPDGYQYELATISMPSFGAVYN
ncbi:hypothetical protein [Nocardia stercoris]|uniref:Tat pathway signal protein n=1 Tax=Nocardia stercoris TaxID=2483361 RepID=A0A3M2KYN8_9NOCA|nr:hypothetical protein [Nocardia stercoris]RMI29746.1 hypothetical protein EBN03_25210 [Nocardia stercoris]